MPSPKFDRFSEPFQVPLDAGFGADGEWHVTDAEFVDLPLPGWWDRFFGAAAVVLGKGLGILTTAALGYLMLHYWFGWI